VPENGGDSGGRTRSTLMARASESVYIYIYIYICVCVCVCVCFGKETRNDANNHLVIGRRLITGFSQSKEQGHIGVE